jgi:hypothetical protein
MKELIRHILNEEVSNEKLAKAYLSRLNLKPWKNDRYRFVFLATPKGTSIILVIPDDHEFCVQDSTYDMLLKFLKTEDNVANFLYDYMIDLGIKLNFRRVAGWVSKSENVGGVDEDDEPYFDFNNLNESSNPVKNYWFKKWSRQKEKGETPSIHDIEKLGLSKKRNEIIQYFVEFMGYNDVYSRSEAVKQYLLNHTFTEKEITEMDNFDQGKIKVKFSKVEFTENFRFKSLLDLDIEFKVLSGSFYNSEEDETYNFSSNENPFEDFVTYFEFKEEIEQVVESFIHKTLESFGYNINNDFDYVSVKW